MIQPILLVPKIALTLAGALFTASDEPLQLHRTFKTGDSDTYAVKLSFSTDIGDVDVQMKVRQVVKKAQEDGGALMESETQELKTSINGEKVDQASPKGKKVEFRLGPFGVPVPSGSGKGMDFIGFFGMVPNKPLIKGLKTPIEFESSGADRRAKGEVTLESMQEGEAKLTSHWELNFPEYKRPILIDMTSFIEIKSGKTRRASGSIVGPLVPGVDAKAIQFSLEAVPN